MILIAKAFMLFALSVLVGLVLGRFLGWEDDE